MFFIVIGILIPAFAGLLLAQFARNKGKKRITWVVAVCMAAFALAYAFWARDMELESLMRFFYEPGIDPIYTYFESAAVLLFVRPLAVMASALMISRITASLWWPLVRWVDKKISKLIKLIDRWQVRKVEIR